MAVIRAKIRGRERVIRNFEMKKLQMEAGAMEWVNKSTNRLYRKVWDNTKLTCHSYAELARMGHPYGKKHLNNPHSPYYQIHRKSGDLQNALSKEVAQDYREFRGGVGFTPQAEASLQCHGTPGLSYLRPIIFGSDIKTGGMIARPFLRSSMAEIQDQVEAFLMKRMRTAARRKV